MLIKKGFAWAIVDEKGELIEAYCGGYGPLFLTYPTRKRAMQAKEYKVERVVKVKIEIIASGLAGRVE